MAHDSQVATRRREKSETAVGWVDNERASEVLYAILRHDEDRPVTQINPDMTQTSLLLHRFTAAT